MRFQGAKVSFEDGLVVFGVYYCDVRPVSPIDFNHLWQRHFDAKFFVRCGLCFDYCFAVVAAVEYYRDCGRSGANLKIRKSLF